MYGDRERDGDVERGERGREMKRRIYGGRGGE